MHWAYLSCVTSLSAHDFCRCEERRTFVRVARVLCYFKRSTFCIIPCEKGLQLLFGGPSLEARWGG